ncbi:MAG: NAD(P)H-dependent oxidoreductase [Bdellovibrionota bacterium]
MSQAKVLGISSSLNPASVSRCALEVLGRDVRKLGATFEFVDLAQSEWELPLFDPKRANPPAAYLKIRTLMMQSHSIVLATPDYHGSVSGVMKNFLDYFWGEMTGRLFGYVCASHEKGLTVMDQMRTSVRQCYGWSLPYGLSLSETDLNAERSDITNPKVAARVKLLAYDLVTYGPLLADRFQADKGQTERGFAANSK